MARSLPSHTYLKNIIIIVVFLQRGVSNKGVKNYSNNFSTDSIDDPKVSSERCLT